MYTCNIFDDKISFASRRKHGKVSRATFLGSEAANNEKLLYAAMMPGNHLNGIIDNNPICILTDSEAFCFGYLE